MFSCITHLVYSKLMKLRLLTKYQLDISNGIIKLMKNYALQPNASFPF